MSKKVTSESLMTGTRQLKDVGFAERQMLKWLGNRVAGLKPGCVTNDDNRFLTVTHDREQGHSKFTMWDNPRGWDASGDTSVETELSVQITGESPFAPPPIIAMVRNIHTDYDHELVGSYSAVRPSRENGFGIFAVYRAIIAAEKLQGQYSIQPPAPAAASHLHTI